MGMAGGLGSWLLPKHFLLQQQKLNWPTRQLYIYHLLCYLIVQYLTILQDKHQAIEFM